MKRYLHGEKRIRKRIQQKYRNAEEKEDENKSLEEEYEYDDKSR